MGKTHKQLLQIVSKNIGSPVSGRNKHPYHPWGLQSNMFKVVYLIIGISFYIILYDVPNISV